MTKIVYQYNSDFYLIGETISYNGLIPFNCTDVIPPEKKSQMLIKWTGAEWQYEEIPKPSLEELKNQKWQQIKEARDKQEQEGLPYMGKVLDSDQLSVQRLTTAVQAAQLAISQEQEFTINWTTKDNSTLTMTAQQVLGIPIALAQYSNEIHAKAHTLREQVESATSQEELDKISW